VLRTPAPKLGQHTAEILTRIGVGSADLEKLRTQGIV
jgi:crotonobetainyl-CoA:carnitine CoA-transferase CaiB-like acyl-CoA transferase